MFNRKKIRKLEAEIKRLESYIRALSEDLEGNILILSKQIKQIEQILTKRK